MTKSTRAQILATAATAAAFMVSASAANAETITITDTAYAIGQNQVVTGTNLDVAATITAGASLITSGAVTDSSALTSIEIYSTSATGNFASSTLNSSVNNDSIGTALAVVTGTLDAARALATADNASLSVTTAQDAAGVVGDSSQDSSIGISSATVLRSTLTASDNLQESRGVLNVQDSTINLSANATNTSAGIASSQNSEDSSMASAVNSTVSINVAGATSDLSSSTATLSGNDQISVAVGNSGANLISGTVNSAVSLLAANGLTGATATPDDGTDPATATATAGFSVSSNQVVDADSTVSATVGSQGPDGFLVSVGRDVLSSTVTNDSNSALASVRGNENTNRISLSGNSLVTGDGTVLFDGTLAAVANTQEFAGAATATTFAGATNALRTSVGDDVTSSTVTTSSNLIDAAATGNRGANAIVVAGSTIDTGAVVASASTFDTAAAADASGGLALASSQQLTGTVSASLSDLDVNGEGTTGAAVSVAIGASVTSSTVRADSNRLQASAIGNQITANTNSISVTGNSVNTSTALANLQSLNGDVTADIGATTAPFGGVSVDIGSTITASTVTVDGNAAAGSVIGNTASNAISVVATNLNVASGLTAASDAAVLPGAAGSAESNNALANEQSINASTLDVAVYSEFSIVGDVPGGTYQTENSSLSVSNNTQSATAKGNVVANGITLSATNAETGAALSSLQSSDAGSSVTATSTMLVSAPGGMEDSSLALDNNSNTADVAINTASNSIALTEGNVASVSNGVNAALLADDSAGLDFTATADFVMLNQQTAVGTAQATATSTVVNQEGPAAVTDADSVVNSTATADGNETLARAIANTATNSMTLGGNASFEATGGVVNRQDSSANVSAINVTAVGFDFDNSAVATPPALVDSSAVSVSENSAQTVARGNVATNSLTASALALNANPTTAAASVGLSVGNADAAASASYAVLNSQSNTGDVVGSTSVSYSVALNSGGTATTLNASTVNVRNNLTQVSAAGNVASNTLTLTALNHGSSTGVIGNEQVNTGRVTADVLSYSASANFGTNAIQSSAVAVTGNRTTATAVGNSATSVLTRN